MSETHDRVLARARALAREQPELDLLVFGSETASIEAGTGQHRLGLAEDLTACVRGPAGGQAAGPLLAPEGLVALAAAARAAPPAPGPAWANATARSVPRPALSLERGRTLATSLCSALEALRLPVTAVLVHQTAAWSVRLSGQTETWRADPKQLVFARYETPLGPVVDGHGQPSLDAEVALAPFEARAREVLALAAAAAHPVPALPWVLGPSVAAPFVAALASLLGPEGALSRMVGKQLFPRVLSLIDDPLHPLACARAGADVLGTEASAHGIIEQGVLKAAIGTAPGRMQHRGGGGVGRGPVNLLVQPGQGELPADRLELTTRLETFITHVRPGKVTAIAAGWEVRGGERVRRVGPIDLDFQVLELLRRVTATGNDLRFFPSSDEVGVPSLALSPLP